MYHIHSLMNSSCLAAPAESASKSQSEDMIAVEEQGGIEGSDAKQEQQLNGNIMKATI